MPLRSVLGGLLLLVLVACLAEDVPLSRDGGVWKVPVRVNQVVSLDFIVDSGASEVCIPADVVGTLLRAGTVQKADMLPSGIATLADGSRHTAGRFKIRQLELGTLTLTDVDASITPARGPLLLGESCLQRLPGGWRLDYDHRIMRIGDEPAPVVPVPQATPVPTHTPTPRPHASEVTVEAVTDSEDNTPWLILVGLGVLSAGGAVLYFTLRPRPRHHDEDSVNL
jgi:hypothetical protein